MVNKPGIKYKKNVKEINSNHFSISYTATFRKYYSSLGKRNEEPKIMENHKKRDQRLPNMFITRIFQIMI